MNDASYFAAPFLAWFLAGCIKFSVNSIKSKSLAFNQIGYGSFPSNHSSIVTSMVALIGFREGIQEPAFGVAVTLAFVVMLDANSLRRQIGLQAKKLNVLTISSDSEPLRERMGHTKIEIAAGIVVGFVTGFLVHCISQ